MVSYRDGKKIYARLKPKKNEIVVEDIDERGNKYYKNMDINEFLELYKQGKYKIR